MSGRVREAFRALGHDAWSCDIVPSLDDSPFHIQDDVLKHLYEDWNVCVGHPPCTFLTVSNNGPLTHGCSLYTAAEGQAFRAQAVDFFMAIINAPIPHIAVENPVGIMSTRYQPPTQQIQHYCFGEDASKKTGLWLKNLPTLNPIGFVKPRMVCECGHVFPFGELHCRKCLKNAKTHAKPRWANQTDSGQNKLTPSATRSMERSLTPVGLAKAMADQWSWYCEHHPI